MIIGYKTWLKPQIYNAEFLPDGYNMFHKDRPDAYGYGEILVAAMKCIIAREIPPKPNAEAVLLRIESLE